MSDFCLLQIIKGEIGSAPLNVGPGMMEAVFAQQSYSFTKLEGLMHFQVDGNIQTVLKW